MSRQIHIATLMALALAAPTQALGQERSLVDAAHSTLAGLQNSSFTLNREHCGMIGRNARGNLVVTRPRAGQADSCRPRSFSLFRGQIDYVASYHTHGGFDPSLDSEVPSFEDLQADAIEGVIGFVATPGGRLWVTDPELGEVRLVCGPRCLPVDARYNPDAEGRIAQSYTASELRDRARALGTGLDE